MDQEPGESTKRRWVLAHPVATVLLGLVAVLVAAWLSVDRIAKDRFRRQIEIMRADGGPMSVAELNAAMPSISDQENIIVQLQGYADHAAALEVPADKAEAIEQIEWGAQRPIGRRLRAVERDALQWRHEKLIDQLDGIHRVMQLGRGCVRFTWTVPTSASDFSAFGKIRSVARILWGEAALAADEGDSQGAGRILLDLFKVSSAREGSELAGEAGLTWRFWCSSFARDATARAVNLCVLDDETLRRLQAALLATERPTDLKKVLMTERALFLSNMAWARAGTSSVGGTPVGIWRSPGVLSWLPGLLDFDSATGIELMNAYVAAVNDANGESLQRAKAVDARVAALGNYCIFSKLLLGRCGEMVKLRVEDLAGSRALLAALACERYRLATGRWPEDLMSLVPKYLEVVPLDPFDGRPVRYRRIPDGIMLWSIGENMVDNGGDVPRLEGQRSEGTRDVTVVVLNPELRGRAAKEADGGDD